MLFANNSTLVTNTWFTKFLPMSAYVSFDNTGMSYDPTAIVTNGEFDAEKYRAYSPMYMSATLAIAYGVAFASFTSVVVHTFRMCHPFFSLLISLTDALSVF